MSLAQMQHMPERSSPHRRTYDYAHWQDHLAIIAAINRQFGKSLLAHPIWPASGERQFLQNHQALHDDMIAVQHGMPRYDFTVLDDKDDAARRQWAFLNYQQHNNMRLLLRIEG